MRINVAVPEHVVSPEVLNAALEATTRLDESLIANGEVPLFSKAVKELGVRWQPEPPGDEHFDHAGVVTGRKWGDCDDLAPYHAASLRATGADPGAAAVVKKSGPNRWHAIVQRSDGSFEDPSAAAGMHEYVRAHGLGVVGAGLPLMFQPAAGVHGAYIAQPTLALRPVQTYGSQAPEAWQSRVDLPWHGWEPGNSPTDVAMVTLHSTPVSSQAIVGALRGAVALGEANDLDPETLDRLDAIAAACEGYSWHELAEVYGPETATHAGQVVGSFFGGLMKAVTAPISLATKAVAPVLNIAKGIPGVSTVLNTASSLMPLASKVLPFVPGVGPLASMALSAATPALQSLLKSGGNLPPGASAPIPTSTFARPMAPAYGGGGFGGGGGGGAPGPHVHVHFG